METEGSGADDAAAGMDGVVRKSDFANAKVVDGMSSNSAAARQRRTAKLRAEYGEIPLTFYLTLAITNLDEATFEQVKLAAGDSFGYEEEKVSTAYLPRLAGFIASKVLSPETMTEQVSDELARQLPDKLKDFGIEMHMKTVFCHGCIAVVECLACDVALKKLIELAGAQRKCCKDAPVLKCILKCLQCCGFDDDVEALIVRPRAVEKVCLARGSCPCHPPFTPPACDRSW